MPPSPRSPGPYSWSLRWPALGLTLNAPFDVSKWLPGPFGGLGMGWAGVAQGVWGAPPYPTRATQGGPQG